MTRERHRHWRRAATVTVRIACLFAALGTIVGYHVVGAKYYRSYWVPQGVGMISLLPDELAHFALYGAFSLVAVALLVVAFDPWQSGGRVAIQPEGAALRGSGLAVMVTAVAVAATTFLISRHVLQHTVISDDEHVYRFIAQTLRTGSLTASSPGSDLEFFREAFVVLTDQVRYGKYPIGHPLLLAAGQMLGLEHLVVPLTTAAIVLPTYRLGVTVFGRQTALLGSLLLLLSPQVLLTGATLFSQPISALCLMASLACLLAAEQPPRPWAWLAAAGGLLGYAVLVRPLPGALFVPMAAIYVAVMHRPRAARALAPLLLGPILFGMLLLAINWRQSGHWLTSGYQTVHLTGEGVTGALALLGGDFASRALSVIGNLLRLNFWLLGWPLSLVPCLFARRSPRVSLLWGMIGATMFYRVIAAKQGVGATGPLYLFEVVPLFCLLGADGLVRLASTARLGATGALSAHRVASFTVASVIVAFTTFVPTKIANLARIGEAQRMLPQLLERGKVTKALVFYQFAVHPRSHLSWAYYPRCNSPALDDDVLLVRFQRGGSPMENLDFWRRRFPERRAWYFEHVKDAVRLIPLDAYRSP